MDSITSILVVIVLYKCKLIDSISFRTINKQVTENKNYKISFFIYDNSPERDLNIGLAQKYSKIIYYNDKSNPGISKAYNMASRYAISEGYNWLLFLDQDTSLPDNILCKYVEAIKTNPKINLFLPKVRVGNRYISPCRFYMRQGHIMKSVPTGQLDLKRYSAINSGIMIEVNAFEKAGGYNEAIYLDYNDHEFMMRYKKFFRYAYVINAEVVQDFACLSDNIDTLIKRYKILCDCVSHVDKKSIVDKSLYALMLWRRGMHLFLKTGNIIFLRIYLNYLQCKTII